MRLIAKVLAFCVVAVMVAVPAGVAGAAHDRPTITLVQDCPVYFGQQYYGVLASVSGLPPNTTFEGSIQLDGFGASGTFTTDANGDFGPIGVASSVPVQLVTATVVWSGGEITATLATPCQTPPVPVAKPQCKVDGFVAYGFKNQGACVSFLVSHRQTSSDV